MSRFDHRLAAGAGRAWPELSWRLLRQAWAATVGTLMRTLMRTLKWTPMASLVATLLWISAAPAHAAAVTYQATALGGDAWRYDYTVKNDGSPASIDEFTIFFELGLYADLAVAASPAGWDAQVVQPDPNIPADGFFDALALGAGLLSGEEALFSVTFTYSGPGAPFFQSFDVVYPITFNVI